MSTPTLPQPTMVLYDHNEEALAQLRDLMPDTFYGDWAVAVAAGSPADAIVRVAHKRDADLIVMGTRKRTGRRHVLLGSVADKVVRLAACPVLTVIYGAHEARQSRITPVHERTRIDHATAAVLISAADRGCAITG